MACIPELPPQADWAICTSKLAPLLDLEDDVVALPLGYKNNAIALASEFEDDVITCLLALRMTLWVCLLTLMMPSSNTA